jgi:hypothetical protein
VNIGPEDVPELAPVDSSVDASFDTFDAGVGQVDSEGGTTPEGYQAECDNTKRWLDRIKKARAFDENQRKQYALNRRYLRGDTGRFEISVPLAPSYTEILTSILYAKNPDLDVQPAPSTTPPPMPAIIEMARSQIIADPQSGQMMEKVGIQAETKARAAEQAAEMQGAHPPPLPEPGILGETAAQAWLDKEIKDKAKEIMQPYRRALEDAKQFAKTIDIVVSDAWTKARLKKRAKQELRSTLGVGIGWLKCSWQDRAAADPLTTPADDTKQALDRITVTQGMITEPRTPTSNEANQAALEAQKIGLQSGDKAPLHRGFVIDFIPAQDIQVDPNLSALENYEEAGWIAHRVFKSLSQSKIDFPDIKDKLDGAQKYFQAVPRNPVEKKDTGPIAVTSVDANEAELFRTNANIGTTSTSEDPNICSWEIWSKDDNVIYTVVEGVPCYARQPFAPNVRTTRFYGMFMLAMHWLDNERHPESLITRISPLLDEVNAIHSDARTHRRRAIPKTLFNSADLAKDEAKKIEGATSNEIIPLEMTSPKADVGKIFKNFQYPPYDKALYSDAMPKAEIETATGVQEAMTSSIMTAKTATEAEIQQTGTNARSSFQRDEIDEQFTELAQYTAEILVQKYTHDDVVQIAGPWAFWPGPGADGAQGISLERMNSLITVKIKAGSSGKPNTSAAQQAWAVSLPLLQRSIAEIGQLRGSSPADMADCQEELVEETLARAGERLDPTRFIPQAPSQEPGQMQQPPPGAMPPPGGPQPRPMAPPHPMPATLPAPNAPGVLPVPHRGHVTEHNRPPAALITPTG